MQKTYAVYIMTNRHHTVLCTGVTGDLLTRVGQHRNGRVEGFTKRYNVDKLVYVEEHRDVRAAIAREKQIKGWSRRKKEALIDRRNPEWRDLYEDLIR